MSRTFPRLALVAVLCAFPLAAQEAPASPEARAFLAELEQLTSTIEGLRGGLAGLSAEKNPAEWAAAQNRLGGLLTEASTYLDGAARTQVLRQAVAAYHEALEVLDREKEDQEWSIVSYNLGSTLLQLGEAVEGDEAKVALRSAISTLEPIAAVLPAGAEVLKAAVYSHHGDALLALGGLLPPEEGRLQIERALQLFGQALTVLPKDAPVQQRAMLSYSRARAATELAVRQNAADAAATREIAIAAYEDAAQVFGREQDAELFVQIRQELGILKLEKALGKKGEEAVTLAREAADAFQQGLAVVTREMNADIWGSLQGGLGAALLRAGKSSPMEDARAVVELENATQAFENLLKVLPREKDPEAWAQTQHNLGSARRELGERLEDAAGVPHLRSSLVAYRAALEVIQRDKDEAAWAETGFNLVLALRSLARRLEPEEASDLVDEASAVMREVGPVLEKLGAPPENPATPGS